MYPSLNYCYYNRFFNIYIFLFKLLKLAYIIFQMRAIYSIINSEKKLHGIARNEI